MAQSTRVKERQAAQALRIKQAQAFMVPDNIDVAILGGGAAGLCAAITAAEALGANKRVAVFEKALESGRTILATGGGRCNFTNADLSFENFSHPEFVQAVCRDKGTFLADILSFFRSSGLAWATEDEGRMYPLTRQASSIQSLLLRRAQKAGVQFALGRKVTSVNPQHNGFTVTFQECFAGEKTYKVHASSVVLATGGLTTAELAENLDLQTTSLRPGLCALTCTPEPPASLDGKRVRAQAALLRDGNVLKQESGELLFRPFGLSGIMIFNLSRTALPRPREVKASTSRVNIKGFSSDKQTWNAARLKCVCTHLFNGNTTNTDLWNNFGGCTGNGKSYFVSFDNSGFN